MSNIAGRIRPTPPALRYVVLRHDGVDDPHFDLMFETLPRSKLTTWRSEKWPIKRPTRVTRIADHRAEYLHYEGPISEGRGTVRRVTAGVYRLEKLSDIHWRMTFRDTLGFSQLQFLSVDGNWTVKTGGR